MADFEMPYFVDGGGNKGYFKDTTAREQITDVNSSKCQGANATSDNTSPTVQMDNLRTAHKSGVYPMYCSSGNPDFSTIGYCMALGAIFDGGVSTITAINSQTGDIWTNGNTSQTAGAWTGWKNNSAISLFKKLNLTSTPTEVDMGAGDGVYLILVAQSAGLDCMGVYLAKITNYESGTKLKTILTPQSYAPTIAVTARSSTVHGKITFTSEANMNAAIYKCNIF